MFPYCETYECTGIHTILYIFYVTLVLYLLMCVVEIQKTFKRIQTNIKSINDTTKRIDTYAGRINIQLNNDIKEVNNLVENSSKDIYSELDHLNQYEVVHIHIYPDWHSLTEFQALPGFQYFEACRNISKFLKVGCNAIGNKDLYLGKILGCRYSLKGLNKSTCNRNYNFIDTFPVGTGCGDCQEDKNSIQPNYLIHKVHELLINENLDIHICLYSYIIRYVTGWMLLNHEDNVFRNLRLTVIIDGDDCSFTISRLKYICNPKLTHTGNLVHIPKCKICMVINDVRFGWTESN
jgi:hypothetical protein